MARNINQSITDLTLAIDELIARAGECCQGSGGMIDSTPSVKQPEYGNPGDIYQTKEQYFNARCNSVNAIHDTILETVVWLKNNNVDLKAGVFGGITVGLALGLTLSGPGGWAVLAISSLVATLSVYLIQEAFNFEDVENALDAEHADLITALYTATDASNAKAAYLAVLDAGTVPLSTEEMIIIGLLLSTELLNQIFEPRADMAAYESPDPVVCSSSPLIVWSFESGLESWTHRDDSTGGASSTMAHSAPDESMENHCIIPAGGAKLSLSVNISPSLAFAVSVGDQIVVDHDAVSDGIVVFRNLTAIYDDAREFTIGKPAHISSGSITLAITASGTIESIEINVGRNYTSSAPANDFLANHLEVRIE